MARAPARSRGVGGAERSGSSNKVSRSVQSMMALHRRRQRQSAPADGSGNGEAEERAEQQDAPPPSPSKQKDATAITPSRRGAATAVASGGVAAAPSQSFHVARFAILRLTGFVYLVAFVGAYHQNRGLMGAHGLVPASPHMARLRESVESPLRGFLSHPSLYWFTGSSLEDAHLDATAALGTVLSSMVVLGLDSWLVMALLWILDFSIVTAAEGNSFYSYGWESQLLETGFLAIWLCDLPSLGMLKGAAPSPPSLPVLWLFRWLCARISIGAGLIKLRGGKCWQQKTCLYYHFETQPIPSPMSFLFHFLPKSVLRRAVDLDFFVQLHSIWLVLIPGFNWYLINLRRIGGFIQAGFMINIILSGNFAFLNHVTIIPALACLDDACYPTWLRRYVCRSRQVRPFAHSELRRRPKMILRWSVDACLVVLIGMLSVPVVTNLLQMGGKHQMMNASFNSFRLVNTYGAFGSVGEARYEPIISVSSDGQIWSEIELPCKPGSVNRRPCFSAPYHYRLDWNIWFIGFKPHQSMLQRRERWMYELIYKILESDPTATNDTKPWLALLDASSVDLLQRSSVKYAKVDMWRYRMAQPLWVIARELLQGREVIWWERDFEEKLIPPVQIQDGRLVLAR